MVTCDCVGPDCRLGAIDPRHGTRGGYANHKCRCTACADANATYQAAYAERNRDRLREQKRARQSAPITHPHLVRVDPDELALATRLIEDGASHLEVARTVGWQPHTVARHFPGTAWTREQVGQFAVILQNAA